MAIYKTVKAPTAEVYQRDGRIHIVCEDETNGKTTAAIPNTTLLEENVTIAKKAAEEAAEVALGAMEKVKSSASAAAASAESASNFASAAATSEKNASVSETSAASSEKAAAASATAAATSETNAKVSEENAASSAAAASSQATAASAAASTAEAQATSAAGSAEAAAGSAAEAATSASNAAASEAAAEASKTEASSSAAAAQKSEASAAASATSAADSASKAMATTPEGYEALVDQVADMRDAVQNGRVIYGFHIDSNESDPDAAVTYLKDAVGMTPAKMDYTNGVFDYGSWEDAFFMPRPCMLNQDGTVAYYLDPNDLTKKEDGTDSDVANTTFAGNAMMEWGRDGKKIWLCVVPKGDGTSADVFISNRQVTDDYHAWSFMDANGAYIDHFYTPIYNGSRVSNVLRSISGQAVSSKRTVTNEISCAKANGDGWMTETYNDRLLINYLLILISKSLATQEVFGQGITSGSETAFNAYTTGALNDKGLFYGSSDESTAVKVFGMENYWGLQWRRTAGLTINGGTLKYKLTESDADGASGGYTTTGADYIDAGVTISGASGAYIKKATYTADGAMVPTILGGSSSQYYGDGMWFVKMSNTYALFGGASSNGGICGAFYLHLASSAETAGWLIGAAVSCKPLAT